MGEGRAAQGLVSPHKLWKGRKMAKKGLVQCLAQRVRREGPHALPAGEPRPGDQRWMGVSDREYVMGSVQHRSAPSSGWALLGHCACADSAATARFLSVSLLGDEAGSVTAI